MTANDSAADIVEHLDQPIALRDGVELLGDVFLPPGDGTWPTILSVGPYGKDIPFETFHPKAYALIDERGPRVNWETPTPDWWVPHGYAVVRVDQRGTGKSPGRLDFNGPGQALDYYDVIEWAAAQPWCNGKVGLLGISAYALAQWQVAALQPPSLAAIVPWEGASDFYREFAYKGGMLNNVWTDAWWHRQIVSNQHADAPPGELAEGNTDYPQEIAAHPLVDDFWLERSPRLDKITVPVLSAGNWGGVGLHLRGNIEGYLDVSSEHKWLRVHTGNHTTPFYTDEGKAVQRRFLDHWLKGHDNGLLEAPRIELAIRRGRTWTMRAEHEWPLARTSWTRLRLDAERMRLAENAAEEDVCVRYAAPGGETRFLTDRFDTDVEVTGPLSADLWISTDATDIDVHLAILNLDENGREVTVDGGRYEPNSVTYGWLRASRRETDPDRSAEWRPYHPHTSDQPLRPGDVARLHIEIWPTSMVFEAGHRLALVVGAQDYHTCSFTHTDKGAAGRAAFEGTVALHTGPGTPSSLLLPVIPAE